MLSEARTPVTDERGFKLDQGQNGYDDVSDGEQDGDNPVVTQHDPPGTMVQQANSRV